MYLNNISARKRKYTFQVKKSVDNINYLVVEERIKDRKMGKIMIFEDHMVDFLKGLGEALDYFKKTKDKSYSIEFIRKKYPMAYRKWTPDEDDKLRKLFSEGKEVKELCKVFQRNIGSIRSKIKKIIV